MTPEAMVFPLHTVGLTGGMYSGEYNLEEFASIGQWQIVARFQTNPQQTYSAKFEVKKYVPSSYEVKLMPQSPFFYYTAPSFTVRVKATYVFGKGVEGVAFVMFGVLVNGIKIAFPSSLQRITITGGNGEATLQKKHILSTFPNIEELIQSSLFVTAVVHTESGSEMVEEKLKNVPIVTSPYVINFQKTPKYFKAGMPFDVTVTVTYPDGSPAEGVPVVVEPGPHLHDHTQANGRVSLMVNTRLTDTALTITARTNDHNLPDHKQATKSMVARLYETESKNYIQINVMTKNVTLGSGLNVQLHLNSQSRQFETTYLIISRGQLVHFGKIVLEGQAVKALVIPVTKKMLPSFRMIAYYHATPTEVVSDSVWVDVENSCTSSLKLEPKTPVQSLKSTIDFQLKVTGEPGATVGLVAVNKGLNVQDNKHHLTQRKVWQIVEQADTGCTPGGGRNSMGVFVDAGLMFQTNTAGETPYRQELKCPHSTMEALTLPDANFIGHSAERDSYTINSQITSHTRYFESWSWHSFKIPECTGNSDCDVKTHDMNLYLKNTISTWTFSGISLSENGICVGRPLDVVVFQTFFIDLRLPYSAVVGEQIEIQAVLHNYMDDPITAQVELVENAHVCSSAWKEGTYTQEVRVGPSTTNAVSFVIIPLKEGVLNIEVKATDRNSGQSDEVIKQLRVVPYGVLTTVSKGVALDPKGGTQEHTINSAIPRTEMIPNTPSITRIFVTGKEQIRLQSLINASPLGGLIRPPSGHVSMNIIHTNRPVTATVYLDRTNQWEAVGLEKRSQALAYIETGIQTQMSYASSDGSFFEIRNTKSSTRVTAYVIKVLLMAKNLLEIDNSAICNAVKYLIVGVQKPDGTFPEVGQIYPPTIIGDLSGRDSDASLTAFCLIAIRASTPVCQSVVSSLPSSIDKSVAYLESRLPSLTNPYAVAIASYALANEHKLNKDILYNFISPERTHWAYPGNDMLSLETTAYALLALVRGNLLNDAEPVVEWFKKQQRRLQSHESHAALMMYQALSEYWTVAHEPDYNLEVELNVPGRFVPYRYHFNKDNYNLMRKSKTYTVNEDVTVTARGTGEGTLTMVTTYYAIPKEISDDSKFNLSLDFSIDRVDEENGDIYRLRVRFSSKNPEEEASMSVLDIALLPGFIPLSEDLEALSKGLFISKRELNKAQSEKGSILLYLDKVAHNPIEELQFRMRQTHKAGILQPAAVSLYEYYDDTTKCVKYYHPQRRDGQFRRLCRNAECVCAENSCVKQKKGDIGARERTEKICESTPTGQTAYLYRASVVDLAYHVSFDHYVMRIERVIKEGTKDRNADGQLRNFYSSADCRESLDLQRNKEYLIMGTGEDIVPDTNAQSISYWPSKRTWIEYSPTAAECAAEEHRRTCISIQASIFSFETNGCMA